MDHVRKRVEVRQKFLVELHGLADGQPNFSTTVGIVAGRAGIDEDAAREAANWWRAQGFLVVQGGDRIQTNVYGMQKADRLIREPGAGRQAGADSKEGPMGSGIRVFISHASVDVELAQKLIVLLEASLEVPEGAIRCTSVTGYKLEGGDDAPEVLRRNLEECSVVIALLTTASIASKFVLMELGAAWGFRKTAVPFLAPGVGFADLPGPFRDLHTLQMAEPTDVASLVGTVGRKSSFPARNNRPKEQAAIAELVESATAAKTT